MNALILVGLWLVPASAAQVEAWKQAEENGRQSQRVIKFCNRHAQGWLSHADPQSGLLPRTVKGNANYWNAQDCAADNYPFLVLTAYVTDNYYLKRNMQNILEQEQKLCNRLDALPDDFAFATQKFRTEKPELAGLIFGASEYCKDGLIPISEWIGPSPWLNRMEQLMRDVWKHAPFDSPVGKIPSNNEEVNGDIMEVVSRLYWLTGNDQYKEWGFRLADYYLLHKYLLEDEWLRLRDHGCEVTDGLSEVYVIAAHKDPERRAKYKPRLYGLLERILKYGLNADGMMYNSVKTKNGTRPDEKLSDGWGYVYNAFLTVAMVDGEERFRQAVAVALQNLPKYRGYDWEHGSADGYADSIEGALYLLNRIPVASGFDWVDSEVEFIFKKQRHDGIIEGWYGDGNSTRTLMMYALWKTQGLTLSPWWEDMQLGAVREKDGTLRIFVKSDWQWVGRLRFDVPRHRQYFHMPLDYPRINQFPEWFTVEPGKKYEIQTADGKSRVVEGREMLSYPLILEPNEPVHLTVIPR